MANKKLVNKRPHAVVIQHTNGDGDLATYVMTARQVIVADESHLSQDTTDKEAAGHLTITTTTDEVTPDTGTDWS